MRLSVTVLGPGDEQKIHDVNEPEEAGPVFVLFVVLCHGWTFASSLNVYFLFLFRL